MVCMTSEPTEHAPLRIAIYSPALPDSGVNNGIVPYSRIMRDALRALGHSVMIVTADQIEHTDGCVADLPRPTGVLGRARMLLEARRFGDGLDPWSRLHILSGFKAARRAGAQVFEMEETFGWAGRLAGHGVPIVERLHGPHCYGRDTVQTAEEKRFSDLWEAAELASFSKVQAVTSPSQRLLDAVVDRYSLHLPIVRAIPNPMPVLPLAETWRIERADPEQILCVGRFDRRKGADIVVQAFARALEHRPSLTLVMVGPDLGLAQPDGSTVYFDEFAAKELSPETRSRIRFLGLLPPERIPELRLQSAFTLVGSRYETFPYSIAEAMAAGMPVLATDVFGNGEMVRDGIEGRIVPVADVAAMTDAILEMASDPDRLARMGQSAYARASEWLSPERIARETVKVYREAMAGMQRAR
jgi:glycosyltransferase involved in cell wall biosynthesis